MPNLRVVGIGEARLSASPDDVLVTYSLGSCIGLAVYDPVLQLGGLAHFMLPFSSLNRERAARQPAMYADTGVLALLTDLLQHGADRRRLVVSLYGGSTLLSDDRIFRIGERNVEVVRRMLQRNRVGIAVEDVGGSRARTVYLNIADGSVRLRGAGGELAA